MEVTVGQWIVIRRIENNTGHKFRGKTKDEARAFISAYIDESKSASEAYKEKNRKMWNEINYIEYDYDSDISDDDYFDNWFEIPY